MRERGRLLLIGSEDVEVWPEHCGDSHRCIQCYFNGKYFCAPRWRHPIKVPYALGSPSLKSDDVMELGGRKRISIEACQLPGNNFNAFDIAQPSIPIHDGGFVEEITERLMIKGRQYSPRQSRFYALTRYTDKPCPYCGYLYSKSIGGAQKAKPYWILKCPQCQREWTDNPDRRPLLVGGRIATCIEEFAVKRKKEGATQGNIIQEINEFYHFKISDSTITRYTRGISEAIRDEKHRAVVEAYHNHPELNGRKISRMLNISEDIVNKTLHSLRKAQREERTNTIIKAHLENPGVTEEGISRILNIPKGTVNKALRSLNKARRDERANTIIETHHNQPALSGYRISKMLGISKRTVYRVLRSQRMVEGALV